MKEKTLEQHLEENPKAKQHETVIRQTLKALEELRAAGFVDNEYDLEPPYGGSGQLQGGNSRRIDLSRKMTYTNLR
jgi:hypothetical protein